MSAPHITLLSKVSEDDLALVGADALHLADLEKSSFPILPGFVINTNAFYSILSQNHIGNRIENHLHGIDLLAHDDVLHRSQQIQKLFLNLEIPDDIAVEIAASYNGFTKGGPVQVSASHQDLDLPASVLLDLQRPEYVSGDANLIQAIKEIWSKVYTPEGLRYLVTKSGNKHNIGVAILVQMLPTVTTSGVMFTHNPVRGDKNTIVIETVWGLPDLLLQSKVDPDHYEVSKSDLRITHADTLTQHHQNIFNRHNLTAQAIPPVKQNAPKLDLSQINKLATLGRRISNHFFFPQEVHWLGLGSEFFITKVRDSHQKAEVSTQTKFVNLTNLNLIMRGSPASSGIYTGHAKLINSSKDVSRVNSGDIIVVHSVTPDIIPAMRKAGAIITDIGGQITHATIIARELGLPCIVGTGTATKTLKTGHVYTVNAASGEIYEGSHTSKQYQPIPVPTHQAPVGEPLKSATKIYFYSQGDGDAISSGKLSFDGAILSSHNLTNTFGLHPKQLFKNKLHNNFRDDLKNHLQSAVYSFGHRPVIYQISHQTTSEHLNLTGGKIYENIEHNNILGFRGVIRHLADPKHLELELAAFSKARQEGATTLQLMITGARSKNELQEIKKIITSAGIVRTSTMKLWFSVETPAMAVSLDSLFEVGFDGIAINIDTITALSLGYDPHNSETASYLDSSHESVVHFLDHAVSSAKAGKSEVLIYTTANLPNHDLLSHFVDLGVTAVTAIPTNIESTRYTLNTAEHKKISQHQ